MYTTMYILFQLSMQSKHPISIILLTCSILATFFAVLLLQFSAITYSRLIDLDAIFEAANKTSTVEKQSTTLAQPTKETNTPAQKDKEKKQATEPVERPKPTYYTAPQPVIKMFYQPGPQYKTHKPGSDVKTTVLPQPTDKTESGSTITPTIPDTVTPTEITLYDYPDNSS